MSNGNNIDEPIAPAMATSNTHIPNIQVRGGTEISFTFLKHS